MMTFTTWLVYVVRVTPSRFNSEVVKRIRNDTQERLRTQSLAVPCQSVQVSKAVAEGTGFVMYSVAGVDESQCAPHCHEDRRHILFLSRQGPSSGSTTTSRLHDPYHTQQMRVAFLSPSCAFERVC